MEIKKETSSPGKDRAFKIGVAGGGLGALAGIIQLTAGTSILHLTGNKDDTLVLGLITIILSGFAVYCSYRAYRETSTDMDRRIAWFLGITIPALICFTTFGLLWLIPGILLLISTGLFTRDMVHEFDLKEIRIISSIPHWKRTVVLSGSILIIIPVIFGSFVDHTELAHAEQDNDDIFVRPIDLVVREGPGGNTTRSEVSGVMIVHLILIMGSIIALVSGQLGARTVTILSSVTIIVGLLFFFFLLPNILFVQGVQFRQFDGEHFSALSGGWFMAIAGSILISVSEFIKTVSREEKDGQG